MRVIRWLFMGLLCLVGVAVVAGLVAVFYFHIPSNAAGMAAKSVCSARYVAGRPAAELLEQDVYPASPFLAPISVEINDANRMVTAKYLRVFPRRAVLVADRGCVLEGEVGDAGTPYRIPKQSARPWPAGDRAEPVADWPKRVRSKALRAAVASAFARSGDPTGPNTRSVAVVQGGKLLVNRSAEGWNPGTPQTGWSMAKTVGAMLAHKVFTAKGLQWDTPVVRSFPDGREPGWVAQWRADDRAQIRLSDLLYMRSGIDLQESYQPWGSVVQMLYGQPDMASWAAGHGAEAAAGSRWRYLSADSVILAQVVQAQFDDPEDYWRYADRELFAPIGARSATLETDTEGTWVSSSYLWASPADWARLGQLLLKGGRWEGQRVVPAGWAELARTPAMTAGEGLGYGAQVWLPGTPEVGQCAGNPGIPADTLLMGGHWGQMVAAVPSRDAVVVRLGATYDEAQFDKCQFLAQVLDTLE